MTTENPTLTRASGASLILAPIGVLLGWGAMRLGGEGGHEPYWTIAHLIWLPGYLMLALGFVGIHRLIGARSRAGRILAGFALTLTVIGAAAVTAQMLVDLWNGLATDTPAEMSAHFDRVTANPLVDAAVYSVGPALLFLGPVMLCIQAAALRRVPALTAVLVTAAIMIGAGEAAVELPYSGNMLLTAIVLWIALAPLGRRMLRGPEPAAPQTDAAPATLR